MKLADIKAVLSCNFGIVFPEPPPAVPTTPPASAVAAPVQLPTPSAPLPAPTPAPVATPASTPLKQNSAEENKSPPAASSAPGDVAAVSAETKRPSIGLEAFQPLETHFPVVPSGGEKRYKIKLIKSKSSYNFSVHNVFIKFNKMF